MSGVFKFRYLLSQDFFPNKLTFHGYGEHAASSIVAGVTSCVCNVMRANTKLVRRPNVWRGLRQFGLCIVVIELGVISDRWRVKVQGFERTLWVSSCANGS